MIDEAYGFLKDLLRINTSNPPGNETGAVDFIARILTEAKIPFSILEASPGRPNLIAEVKGVSSHIPFLLSSHLDVVPVEESSDWSEPPFAGNETGGMLFGRGSLDMKYKSAFDLAALLRYQKSEAKSHTLRAAFLADEEQGGKFGVKFVTSKHLDAVRADYVLNELGGFNIELGGKNFLLYQVGEKGTYRLSVECRGKPSHGSIPSGGSSIEFLGRAIQRLGEEFGVQTTGTYYSTDTSKQFFGMIAEHTPSPMSDLFRALNNGPSGLAALDAVPEALLEASLKAQLRAMVCNTVAPTMVKSGLSHNIIPGLATLLCDVRLMPDSNAEAFLQKVKKIFPEKAYSVSLLGDEGGYEIPLDDAVLKQLSSSLEASWKVQLNEPISVPMLLPASSDNGTYFTAGIRPIGFAPLLFPRGFSGFSLSHTPDERIPRSSFYEGLSAYLTALDSVMSGR